MDLFNFNPTISDVKADIYKGVISDVINQVKEAFLDENVDIDVLHQLKKVSASALFLSFYYSLYY
ncbi:hypothetical protein M569_16859 [Genlisea aurea]|uniref:Uncharacterized protein n=1 Tax=Genlisea aurea TaxID=192259 RepID=S8D5R6_9LAMI|nr:hypothetical protein M569_16859 [Genlisea aurea]